MAGVALVHGNRVQRVPGAGLPGIAREADQTNPRPLGRPTTYLTWLAGPRQVTITASLWAGKSTAGPSIVLVYRTEAGRTAGLAHAIAPVTRARPWEYQMWWSARPVQTASTARRPARCRPPTTRLCGRTVTGTGTGPARPRPGPARRPGPPGRSGPGR